MSDEQPYDPPDDLLRWLAGALADDDAAAFEERLFDDEALAETAARLSAVRDALRAMAAQGPLVPVVTEAQLRDVAARVVVAEHHPRQGVVRTRLGDEAFVAAHVPLATSAPRVHVLFCTPEGAPYFRVNEAPFDPVAGEVIVLCERHVAQAAGHLVVKVVDDDGAALAEVAIVNVP